MSRINFANLTRERPELRRAWDALDQFLKKHPRIVFLDVPRLAREMKEISSAELSIALSQLERLGFAKQTFRVKNAEGKILSSDYESPEDIPEEVPDDFMAHQFRTSEGQIVTGFLLEGAGGRPE